MENNILKYEDYLTHEEKDIIKRNNISVYFPGLKKEEKFYNYILEEYYNGRIGDHLNFRYEIMSRSIGKGAYGTVIKAFDWKHDKVIAIKVIKARYSTKHFLKKEMKILDIIREKKDGEFFLLNYYGNFTHKNHICFKFDLYDKNLYTYGRKFGKIPIDQSMSVARDLINGLSFLHKHDIIHGDLKPENILFVNSNYKNVVIVDFGLSFLEGDNWYTNNSFYMQSRFYRAPEIILKIKKSKAIDIWSLGCILYEINNNEVLFPGKNNKGMVENFISILGMPRDKLIEIIDKDFKIKYNAINFDNNKKLFNMDWFESKKKDNLDYYKIIRRCLNWDYEKRINIERLYDFFYPQES